MNKTKLKRYLLINAGFSILSGLGMLLFNEALRNFIGFSSPSVLVYLGIALLIFADLVILSAMKLMDKKWVMLAIIGLDELWVFASLVVVIFNPFNLQIQGRGLILEVAAVIAFFAFMQYKHSKGKSSDSVAHA